jgi:CDP-diglyceride synthetase
MHHIHPFVVAQLLVLLALANGTPIIAKKILGTALAHPLDNGIALSDGRRLLGYSKTIRGVVLSIFMTTLCAPWIGLDWPVGFAVSIVAMIGDLLSSFIKRRMKLEPGSRALGLDQVPESLLPALICRWVLPVTVLDAVIVTGLFFVGDLAISRALFALHIRDHPY